MVRLREIKTRIIALFKKLKRQKKTSTFIIVVSDSKDVNVNVNLEK